MGITGIVPGQGQAPPALAGVLGTLTLGLIASTRPTSAPTVAVSAVAGLIEAGTRNYAVSFTQSGSVPTIPGPQVTSAAYSAGNAQGSLTAIPTGPAGTTERRIWRSKANAAAGAPLYLAGVVSDNVTTTFTDNLSDTDLGQLAPSFLQGSDYFQIDAILDAIAGLFLGPTGTKILNLQIYTPSLSPVAVAANTSAEQTFTVTGLATNDKILFINKPTAQAGLAIVGYRVSAANTLAITFGNFTASPITPTAAETYQVGAIRS